MADPNEADSKFCAALRELHDDLTLSKGSECFSRVDLWEAKHCNDPAMGFVVRQQASTMRMALSKNSVGQTSLAMPGIHNTVVVGIASAMADGPTSPVVATEPIMRPVQTTGNTSLVVGLVVGLTAVWWCLPQNWALGNTRLLATVFLLVAGAVIAVLNWWEHKRNNWQPMAYMSLGVILGLRLSVPSMIGSLAGKMNWNAESVAANVTGYLGSPDDATTTIAQAVIAGICLVLAYFSRNRSH